MPRILLALIALLLLPATVHAAPADTQGGLVRVTINAKLTKAHSVRVLPRAQWKTMTIHRGVSDHPGRARWHGSCTHSSPNVFYWGGWYHHYIGWQTYPYIHTHVYHTWSYPGGNVYTYYSNSTGC